MLISPNRRDFLKMAAGITLGSGLLHSTFGQSVDQITATKLGDNYTLLNGAGSNVLVLHGPEGILMVDGGPEERSADLLKAVAGVSPEGRTQALFNTHWHVE